MSNFDNMKLKYSAFLMGTILLCTCFLTFGDYWMPVKTTQNILLENPVYNTGLMQAFLDVEKHIQIGDYLLVDNVPKRVWTENAEISVIKMVDEKKVLPNTKYRIEMKFKHPETVISRSMKLDAIVVNVNRQQNHDFADLFWSLE